MGLKFKPGDEHYRAYVGPPQDYDLISAMVFNLLTCIGLRQHNRILDVGCGSLRVGRLLIPYLNAGNYFGVEPNKWLVDDWVMNEIDQDVVTIKKPIFLFKNSLDKFDKTLNIDFAIAQSFFSHTGKDLIKKWLSDISFHLTTKGVLLATFLIDNEDYVGSGWIYSEYAKYKQETRRELASEFGLDFQIIDWLHPRQTWAIFSKGNYDKSLVEGGAISWNRFLSTVTDKEMVPNTLYVLSHSGFERIKCKAI
ncbi:class I SAM-dependent methyltransferase [Desulfocicer niacini]